MQKGDRKHVHWDFYIRFQESTGEQKMANLPKGNKCDNMETVHHLLKNLYSPVECSKSLFMAYKRYESFRLNAMKSLQDEELKKEKDLLENELKEKIEEVLKIFNAQEEFGVQNCSDKILCKMLEQAQMKTINSILDELGLQKIKSTRSFCNLKKNLIRRLSKIDYIKSYIEDKFGMDEKQKGNDVHQEEEEDDDEHQGDDDEYHEGDEFDLPDEDYTSFVENCRSQTIDIDVVEKTLLSKALELFRIWKRKNMTDEAVRDLLSELENYGTGNVDISLNVIRKRRDGAQPAEFKIENICITRRMGRKKNMNHVLPVSTILKGMESFFRNQVFVSYEVETFFQYFGSGNIKDNSDTLYALQIYITKLKDSLTVIDTIDGTAEEILFAEIIKKTIFYFYCLLDKANEKYVKVKKSDEYGKEGNRIKMLNELFKNLCEEKYETISHFIMSLDLFVQTFAASIDINMPKINAAKLQPVFNEARSVFNLLLFCIERTRQDSYTNDVEYGKWTTENLDKWLFGNNIIYKNAEISIASRKKLGKEYLMLRNGSDSENAAYSDGCESGENSNSGSNICQPSNKRKAATDYAGTSKKVTRSCSKENSQS